MYIYDTYRDFFAKVEDQEEFDDFIEGQKTWLTDHLWTAPGVVVEAAVVVVTPEMMERLM